MTARKNQSGFTLSELLVVVAIIAVLVAVSIPIFTSQLDKAKLSTDQANVRSAKAAALAEYMSGPMNEETTYYYNAASGSIQTSPDGIVGYGKSTKPEYNGQTGTSEGVPVADDGTAGIVAVTIPKELTSGVVLKWTTSGTTGGGTSGTQTVQEILASLSTPYKYSGFATEEVDYLAGNAYTYLVNGEEKVYIATSTKHYSVGDYMQPITAGAWYAVEPNYEDIRTNEDLVDLGGNNMNLVNLAPGTLYKAPNGDLYVYKYASQCIAIPTQTDGNWQKINQ